jgi:hypothetical protein
MDVPLAKLRRELRDINGAISEFERLHAASSSPKPEPVGKAKSGFLFQMIRKKE